MIDDLPDRPPDRPPAIAAIRGGMMFPRIVVQAEARRFLDEFGIVYTEYEESLYVADSIESVCRTCASAIGAGAKVFNLMSVEDVMIREESRVSGLVINWTSVAAARLHVDPLNIRSKVVIDGTGHDAEVCRIVSKKIPDALQVHGELPMWADRGESVILDFSKEVYPGLGVSDMAVNAVSGSPWLPRSLEGRCSLASGRQRWRWR